MTLSEFQQLVTTLADEGEKLIDQATTTSSLEDARTSLLGRKSGRLPDLFKRLPSLAPSELREAGSLINAGAHQHGMSYSVFMHGLKKAGIEVDRKVLSDIAIHDAAAFTALAEKAKSALDAA